MCEQLSSSAFKNIKYDDIFLILITTSSFLIHHFDTPSPRSADSLAAGEWQEKKAKWRAVLLSLPCCFLLIPKTEHWVHAYNRRQAVLQDHESLARTALQIAVEVATFKDLVESRNPGKGKLSPAGLSLEFKKAGLQSVVAGRPGVADDEESGSSMSPWLITSALRIHQTVLGQSALVEILMDLEDKFGTKSPFHKVANLNVLAGKASSNKSRIFVLQSIQDWILFGLLKPSEVSAKGLGGDKNSCGLVQLFECKQRAAWLIIFFRLIYFNCFCRSDGCNEVLDHFFDNLLPKAGVAEGDRALLKEALCSHAAYRQHSGDGDVTWKARLKQSSLMCFDLIQDLYLQD